MQIVLNIVFKSIAFATGPPAPYAHDLPVPPFPGRTGFRVLRPGHRHRACAGPEHHPDRDRPGRPQRYRAGQGGAHPARRRPAAARAGRVRAPGCGPPPGGHDGRLRNPGRRGLRPVAQPLPPPRQGAARGPQPQRQLQRRAGDCAAPAAGHPGPGGRPRPEQERPRNPGPPGGSWRGRGVRGLPPRPAQEHDAQHGAAGHRAGQAQGGRGLQHPLAGPAGACRIAPAHPARRHAPPRRVPGKPRGPGR